MTGAHRRMYEDRVRSAVKSVRWLLVSLVAGAIAIVGVLVYLLATHPKYLPIVAITMQGIVAVELARRLAVKVLRNRTPSPVVLADWIGDGAFVIGWVAIALLTIGREQGWMHGAFEYAMGGIDGLFAVGMPVYWWRGQRRVVLALTARSVAGRWPWVG
jgi:hypothetical protein